MPNEKDRCMVRYCREPAYVFFDEKYPDPKLAGKALCMVHWDSLCTKDHQAQVKAKLVQAQLQMELDAERADLAARKADQCHQQGVDD